MSRKYILSSLTILGIVELGLGKIFQLKKDLYNYIDEICYEFDEIWCKLDDLEEIKNIKSDKEWLNEWKNY